MTEPYYADDTVQLYLGDMRDVLPTLNVTADLIVADPPYVETSHTWDRWPDGWLKVAAAHSTSMWCFGSQRMFFDHLPEFRADWTLSQDVIGHDEGGGPIRGDANVVWEKHNGSGFTKDRFRRVHEHALHWYRGEWANQHQDTPREKAYDPSDKYERRSVQSITDHTRTIGPHNHTPDGTRLMRSVIKVRSMHGRGINKTEKPLGILEPLISYGCPPGGLVIDPMAGSCSVLEAARLSGRSAIGIELREDQCEAAALRLSAPTLPAA